MNKSEMMIMVLRHQRNLLDELVSDLERLEVIGAEDYSYCGNKADKIIRELKSVKKFALEEIAKGASAC